MKLLESINACRPASWGGVSEDRARGTLAARYPADDRYNTWASMQAQTASDFL